MKPNRKRIVTAVVFAVTLVLGASALALAWRLQQEKATYEEAEAGSCGDNASCPADYPISAETTSCSCHGDCVKCARVCCKDNGSGGCDRSQTTTVWPAGIQDCQADGKYCEGGSCKTHDQGCTWPNDCETVSSGSTTSHWIKWYCFGWTCSTEDCYNRCQLGSNLQATQTNMANAGVGNDTLEYPEVCYDRQVDYYNNDAPPANPGNFAGARLYSAEYAIGQGPCTNVVTRTLSGEVYCQDVGGTKMPIASANMTIIRNTLGNTTTTTSATGAYSSDLTGETGFASRLTSLPTGNLPNGQPYASMVGPTLVPKSYCTVNTSYEMCSATAATNHTGFDFAYTNCTPTPNPTITCTSKSSDRDSSGISIGQSITYTVSYTITEQNLKTLQFTDNHSPAGILSATVAEITPGLVCEDVVAGQFSCTMNGTDAAAQALRSVGSHQVAFVVNVNQARVMEVDQITNNIYEFNGTWGDNNTAVTGNTTACTDTVNVEINPEAVCTGKSITPTGLIDPGQNVTFTINYSNSGDVDGNILITDVVPNGFENVATTTSGCTASGNTVNCVIGTISQSSGTVTITAKAKSNVRDLETNNTATVRIDINGDGTPDDTAPNATEIATCSTEPTPSVAGVMCVSKDASAGYEESEPIQPGDTLTYTVNYTVERGPATVIITEDIPEHLEVIEATLPTGCELRETDTVLYCEIVETDVGDYTNSISFDATVKTDIGIDGATITNEIFVYERGEEKPSTNPDDCDETIYVEHEAPACVLTTPSVMTIRVADLAGTSISLTTTGDIGTHSDLDFLWTATGGTLSSTTWHASSGTPANGQVADVVTWAPPTDAEDTDTFDIKVYVRPAGSTDETGVSDDACESTATITALDLICNWLVPNDEYEFFPFDMTFAADIGGDQGAAFTYDLNYGDGSTHYTGSGTVAAGTTVELPYVPPQDEPHTYDSDTPVDYAPVLTVTNTETGETSVCPTVLGGRTQSEWTIVKDSDVDTCVAVNTTATYSIVVTNTGDYTADLAQVRDTIDSKIDTTTIANIRECDSNGLNCTTYNRTDVVSGRTITWPGRTYTAGESRKYMYTVTVNTAGDYYNVAEAIPETGATVRDDEVFPTCAGKTPVAPETGALSTTAYIAILGMLIVAGSYYAYNTKAGAQIVANVMGKTGRSVRRSLNRKETFERDAIRSEKDKLRG